MRKLGISVFLILSAVSSPALAEWTFRSPQASDDRGSAFVRNAQGQIFDVGCGNDGEISLDLRPGFAIPSEQHEIVAIFPGERGMISLPLECADWGCSSGSRYSNGQNWTTQMRAHLVTVLRRAPNFEVKVWRADGKMMEVASFTLKGSSAALSRLKESATGCAGL